jgi:hypothetical protein
VSAEPGGRSGEPRFLLVSIGLGLSSAGDGTASGFYGAGEYVIPVASWASLRGYGALLLTFPGTCLDGGSPCDVSSKVAIAGAKLRLLAPIPYVAPFLDLGGGLMVGEIKHQNSSGDGGTANLTIHLVPFGLGLALGKLHDVELGFIYMWEPIIGHFDGALTLGLSFRL